MAAKTRRLKPSGFVPKYHGFDGIFTRGNKIVIIEAKGGTARLAKGQMSRDWISKNANRLLASSDPVDQKWGNKIIEAIDNGNIQGMVVTTKIDKLKNAAKNPIAEIKNWDSIGQQKW